MRLLKGRIYTKLPIKMDFIILEMHESNILVLQRIIEFMYIYVLNYIVVLI